MLKSTPPYIDYETLRKFVVAEYIVLIAIVLAGAFVFGFFDLADDVLEGDTREIDLAILHALRVADDPSRMIGPEWLHEAVRDLTALGSYTVLTLIVVFVVGTLLLTREWRGALLVLFSVIGGALLSQTLKDIFARPRPDLDTAYSTFTNSFPSGHAMLSAVTFLTLGALLARLSDRWRLKVFYFATAVVLALLVGASRVYLGVHYPSDVIAGWSLGAAWALICTSIAFFLQRRGII